MVSAKSNKLPFLNRVLTEKVTFQQRLEGVVDI
jgi:hypothetical protein